MSEDYSETSTHQSADNYEDAHDGTAAPAPGTAETNTQETKELAPMKQPVMTLVGVGEGLKFEVVIDTPAPRKGSRPSGTLTKATIVFDELLSLREQIQSRLALAEGEETGKPSLPELPAKPNSIQSTSQKTLIELVPQLNAFLRHPTVSDSEELTEWIEATMSKVEKKPSISALDFVLQPFEIEPVIVNRSLKYEVTLKVKEPGQVIVWKFRVEDYDIEFRAVFMMNTAAGGGGKKVQRSSGPQGPTHAPSKTVIVHNSKRYDATMGLVQGCYVCEAAGTATLIWDNSYSMLRSKRIYYAAEVIDEGTMTAAMEAAQDMAVADGSQLAESSELEALLHLKAQNYDIVGKEDTLEHTPQKNDSNMEKAADGVKYSTESLPTTPPSMPPSSWSLWPVAGIFSTSSPVSLNSIEAKLKEGQDGRQTPPSFGLGKEEEIRSVQEFRTRIHALEQENEELLTRNKTLVSKLDHMEDMVASSKAQRDQAHARIDLLRVEQKRSNLLHSKEVAELQSQIEILKEEVQALTADQSAASEREALLERVTSQRDSLLDEVARLTKIVNGEKQKTFAPDMQSVSERASQAEYIATLHEQLRSERSRAQTLLGELRSSLETRRQAKDEQDLLLSEIQRYKRQSQATTTYFSKQLEAIMEEILSDPAADQKGQGHSEAKESKQSPLSPLDESLRSPADFEELQSLIKSLEGEGKSKLEELLSHYGGDQKRVVSLLKLYVR